MRIVEYKITTASTPENLVAAVNKLIENGWQPFGAILVTREAVSGIRQSFMQPMVREPKKRAGRLNKTPGREPENLPRKTLS